MEIRVAGFAWKLGILFVNVLNKCTTTCQKKVYGNNRYIPNDDTIGYE